MNEMQFQSAPEQEKEKEPNLRGSQNRRPDQVFCRDCGELISRNASVCAHCGFVMNPAALQQTEEFIRQREEKARKSRKLTNVIRVIAGEKPVQSGPQFQPGRQLHYEISGNEFCLNCGAEVEAGTSVCMHCRHVINPAAVRRAQLMVQDRMAKLSRKDLLQCLLIPGRGRKYYLMYRENRPQIAKPCRIAGFINTAVLAIIALILFFGFF